MREAIAAVLVNYNAGPALAEALQSMARDPDIDWEAIVIDNASVDGSADAIEREAPWVKLVRNRENIGFGRAVNQGVAATRAPLVLLMNPDCTIRAGTISILSRELAAHPDCAIAGPRILDPDGRVQGSARGDPDMFTGFFGRSAWLQRLLPGSAAARRNVVSPDAATRGSLVVDWVSGACMLARRSAFERVGGFDERYFLYWEDADLCRRLRSTGMHIRYVPEAAAVHQVGQSSRTAPAASIRAFHRSAYLYYATHVAPGAWNPKRLVARALLAARCWWLTQSRPPSARPSRR